MVDLADNQLVCCSGRYNHFAKLLNDHGLKVYAMDWIGELLSYSVLKS